MFAQPLYPWVLTHGFFMYTHDSKLVVLNALPEWAENTHKIMLSLSQDQMMQLAQGSLHHGRESINHLAISYGQFDSAISNVLSPVYAPAKSIRLRP